MSSETWVNRMGEPNPVNPQVVKYLRYMLQQADAEKPEPVPGGGRLKADRKNITLYSGGSQEFFNSLVETLTTISGTPTQDNKSELPKGDIEARSVNFANGIGVVFMAFRDNGISVNIPRNAAEELSRKLDELSPAPPVVQK